MSENTASSSSHPNGNGYAHSQPESEDYAAEDEAINGISHPQPSHAHDNAIIAHLYEAGFQNGAYADTIVHVPHNAYHLHAIILSRSPYLAHLMATSPGPQQGSQRVIYTRIENEPEITPEGFAIALGYLYSSVSLGLVQANNARAVLAAGCLLGGMDDLCQYAYQACRQSVNLDTIQSWIETLPPSDDIEQSPQSIFGPYAQQLRNVVFDFLIKLPALVGALEPPPGNGRQVLLEVFSRVPFEMFKNIIPALNIGSDQVRFKFARECIDMRMRGKFHGETVVLKFAGENGGSAVHITRKKKRPLFLVSSDN